MRRDLSQWLWRFYEPDPKEALGYQKESGYLWKAA